MAKSNRNVLRNTQDRNLKLYKFLNVFIRLTFVLQPPLLLMYDMLLKKDLKLKEIQL